MRGFQLWLNLPAKEKMKPAAYRDIAAKDIPVEGNVKIIAGEYRGKRGPIHGGSTDPYYLDVVLKGNQVFEASLPVGHNAFIYVYEGEVFLQDRPVPHRAAGLLTGGEKLVVEAKGDARFLVLAGKPLGEPIVQYGPFVMNTREEIEQAINDYQSGKLSREAIRTLKVGS